MGAVGDVITGEKPAPDEVSRSSGGGSIDFNEDGSVAAETTFSDEAPDEGVQDTSSAATIAVSGLGIAMLSLL